MTFAAVRVGRPTAPMNEVKAGRVLAVLSYKLVPITLD
jgi:hypothetical protein